MPSVLTDGLQVVSLFGFSHISFNIESVFKMGLKSKEIEHLLIRRLKPTANGPVTIPALLMTDGLLLNSSIISKLAHGHIATLAQIFLCSSAKPNC